MNALQIPGLLFAALNDQYKTMYEQLRQQRNEVLDMAVPNLESLQAVHGATPNQLRDAMGNGDILANLVREKAAAKVATFQYASKLMQIPGDMLAFTDLDDRVMEIYSDFTREYPAIAATAKAAARQVKWVKPKLAMFNYATKYALSPLSDMSNRHQAAVKTLDVLERVDALKAHQHIAFADHQSAANRDLATLKICDNVTNSIEFIHAEGGNLPRTLLNLNNMLRIEMEALAKDGAPTPTDAQAVAIATRMEIVAAAILGAASLRPAKGTDLEADRQQVLANLEAMKDRAGFSAEELRRNDPHRPVIEYHPIPEL